MCRLELKQQNNANSTVYGSSVYTYRCKTGKYCICVKNSNQWQLPKICLLWHFIVDSTVVYYSVLWHEKNDKFLASGGEWVVDWMFLLPWQYCKIFYFRRHLIFLVFLKIHLDIDYSFRVHLYEIILMTFE